jgi:hypothetical protein
VPRPVDRYVVLALRQVALNTAFIRKELPTLGTDDVLFALDWTHGRPVQAAQILNTLNQHRARGDQPPKQRQREPYHRS